MWYKYGGNIPSRTSLKSKGFLDYGLFMVTATILVYSLSMLVYSLYSFFFLSFVVVVVVDSFLFFFFSII